MTQTIASSENSCGGVIWSSVARQRFQIEVQRLNDTDAVLCVFDVTGSHKFPRMRVRPLYGAMFGPDPRDVIRWRIMADRLIGTPGSSPAS